MILSYCFSNFQTFCIISLILSKNPDSIYVISYHARGFLSGFFVFFYSIITYDQSVKKRSQLNGWQLAQNRDCFCDFGRKLVNLSLPVPVECFAAMDGSKSLNAPWTGRLRRTRPPSQPDSGRLRFSYFRTTEQKRLGFVQPANQQM